MLHMAVELLQLALLTSVTKKHQCPVLKTVFLTGIQGCHFNSIVLLFYIFKIS